MTAAARLVLAGPPGGGKGTQARLLADRLGLAYVGTGGLLRQAVERDTPAGRVVGPLLAAGRYAPDALMNDLVAERFRSADRPDRFVLDGYPRTAAQAAAFDRLLSDLGLPLDAVVYLAVPDGEAVRRVGGRWTCRRPGCGSTYHVAAAVPRTAGRCDRCGAELYARADDADELARRRLEAFLAVRDGLVDHYHRTGLLREVPAAGPVEAVYAAVLRSVGG